MLPKKQGEIRVLKLAHSIVVVAVLLLTTGCEYIPFPWGALDGRPAAPLDDWRELADAPIVQLETIREGEPYSVNIWMIAEETHFYVFGGDDAPQWMKNMDANGHARMQIDGAIYSFSGSRVTDQEEFVQFAQAWLDKYGSDHLESSAQEHFLYRLDPVSPAC